MVPNCRRPARPPSLMYLARPLRQQSYWALVLVLTCAPLALAQLGPASGNPADLPPTPPGIPRTDVAPPPGLPSALGAPAAIARPMGTAIYRPYHYFQRADMPPGSIGQAQLMRGGPLPGYYQPVEISAPQDSQLALAMDGTFEASQPAPLRAGLLVGNVYRLKVTNIPFHIGQEVFPSLEIINRLYPPQGSEMRFPIPIELTREELEMALRGQFVIRVIYLEDPRTALPLQEDPKHQRYFEVGLGQDPLEVADGLGRPMAILRIGSRVPELDQTTGRFLFDSPPWIRFPETLMGEPTEAPAPEPAQPSPQATEPSEPATAQGAAAHGAGKSEKYSPHTTAQTRQAGVGVNR